jgi:uncharacterized coiled-coil protein SlyX
LNRQQQANFPLRFSGAEGTLQSPFQMNPNRAALGKTLTSHRYFHDVNMKSKMPLFFILLSGYMSSLAVYLAWYYIIPYYSLKKITDSLNTGIVVTGITALYLFLYFILRIRSLQSPSRSLFLVSVITVWTFFLIPSVYYARYHFGLSNEKKLSEKYQQAKVEAKFNNPKTIINISNKTITELQAKLESERMENDRLRKQLNQLIGEKKSIEKENKTNEDVADRRNPKKVFSKIVLAADDAGSHAKNQEIIFKVQIASSSIRLSTNCRKFKGLKNLWEYKDGDLYKYTVGNQKDIKSASALQSDFRRKGFLGAFVVAFRNGKRIPIKKALDTHKMHGDENKRSSFLTDAGGPTASIGRGKTATIGRPLR